MGDINSIHELTGLYGILRLRLLNVRLAAKDEIREAILYKENREETDSREECFDPIGQAPVIGAEGYWCYTRLFYDVNQKPIRKVPVGKGSWNLRDTKSMGNGDGEKWCKRKLRYGDNRVYTPKFMMTQYSLGEKDDQPNYAICQIFRIADTAAGFREAAGGSRPSGTSQRDLLQNDVVPPENFTRQGGMADESNDILQGHPDAIMNTATVEPAAPQVHDIDFGFYIQQGPPLPGNWNNKRKLEVFDESDGTSWSIENETVIRIVKMFKSAPGQKSTHEIRQSHAASGTEGNQSTMQFPPHPSGAAGISNERAMHQDINQSNVRTSEQFSTAGESSTDHNQISIDDYVIDLEPFPNRFS